jgi:hypothetical protein
MFSAEILVCLEISPIIGNHPFGISTALQVLSIHQKLTKKIFESLSRLHFFPIISQC